MAEWWHRVLESGGDLDFAEEPLVAVPTSVLFHRGSRIRVVVTDADAYTFRTAAVSPAPAIRVLRDPEQRSRIILPVILARAE